MDLRFAIRSLRKTPGFTLLAVLVMALGIGANTAVFSVVNAVLLKPLAYRDPDRIVTISNFWTKTASPSRTVSAPDFHDWHDQSTAFESVAYYNGGQTSVISGPSAEYVDVATGTSEFFQVFQIEPQIGRLFTKEELTKGGPLAAVISNGYWQSHFGGNTNALGKTIRMFDKTFTIVGVLPAGFQFPGKTDVWYPANTIFAENTSRSSHSYLAIA